MNIGQVIDKRFEIQDLLGRGGMGEVYRATDMQTGEIVAVKALNPDVIANDPNLLERFMREGEALRKLNHPNIVHMVTAVEEEGRHYLVMEFVVGGSLRDLFNARGSLPANEVVKIALEVADALTRAHHLGIIHRDLKPANVLLAKDGTSRLADFGIAHIQDSSQLTQTGALVGTVSYLSPEICQGEPPDELSDIWAFGVLLFEMVSGKLPFEGKSMTAKITAILNQPVPDLKQLTPETPDALVDLIYRMLEKDSRQRIPSVRLVGAELEAILKGREPIMPSRTNKEESRFETPAPSTSTPKHNLPVQTTPFVGREAELVELDRLLADPNVRLLSIVGVGGMGKTRLAIETGTRQLERFQHGVYFVSLTPLESIYPIISTIAQVIGFAFHEGGEPRQQLLDFLREKQILLILDNFEHLLEGANLVNEILRNATKVKAMVTSRIKLNVQNEHLFHLEGMDFPDWETSAGALEYSAVKLFLQSARRAKPSFELVADDLKYVARICRLVGGMPLGILLSAAWVEVLSLPEIEKEIEQKIDFLETSLRDVPERQRNMQAVFDYSWNLLTEKEREVFCGLSVFRGGFRREAVQQVTGATLRELMGLMDKSLLQRTPSGRYNLHELLRQYGEKKLLEVGKENALHQRHLEYYLLLAEQSMSENIGWIQREWLPQMVAENDNMRAALGWCMDSGNVQTGLRLAVRLSYFWNLGGDAKEGLDWLHRFLARVPQPSPDRAEGLYQLGLFTYGGGDYAAAIALFKESLALSESLGNLPSVADSTFRLAMPYLAMGNYSQSRHLLERSLKLYQDLKKPEDVAYVMYILGDLAYVEGDFVRARELIEQSMLLQRGLDDNVRLNHMLYDLGRILIHFGELDRSEALFKEAALIEQKLVKGALSTSLLFMDFAFLANARGKPLHAVRLLGAWETLCKATGYHIEGFERPDYESNLASLRAKLDASTFETAWAEGAALTLDQAIELALNDEAPG